jgi:hypothetical protein
MKPGNFVGFVSRGVRHKEEIFKAVPLTDKTDETPLRGCSQAALSGLGSNPQDTFRFTWWNTSEGAAVWIEYRSRWRAGIVVSRGRKYVRVLLTERRGRPVHVLRTYGELRRRVAHPAASLRSAWPEL